MAGTIRSTYRASLRVNLQEVGTTEPWSDTDLNDYLEQATNEAANLLVDDALQELFDLKLSQATVNGTDNYALDSDALRVVWVKYNGKLARMVGVSQIPLLDSNSFMTPSLTDPAAYVLNGKIYIKPTPGATVPTYDYCFVKRPVWATGDGIANPLNDDKRNIVLYLAGAIAFGSDSVKLSEATIHRGLAETAIKTLNDKFERLKQRTGGLMR